MSDLELGLYMGALVIFFVHIVSTFVTGWIENKYTKKIAEEYELINIRISDIKNKLESRG